MGRITTLKDPKALAIIVNLVPKAQTDEGTAGHVAAVPKVHCEEDDDYDGLWGVRKG